MGGNVFKDCSTRRYDAAEYNRLCVRLNTHLQLISNKFDIIPAYKTKESFGDVDVLIIPHTEFNKQYLSNIFNTTEDHIVHNGDVWSLVFEEIQVDLITSNNVEYAASLDYFSWNDYGNLRGKIIHKFGLKYGHNGLTFPVKSENHTLGNVILTQDPTIINSLFDFEFGKEYFTLEEMFESVVKSKYFNPQVFAWEEMNAVARIRDKKRTTYHSFLSYIEPLKEKSGWYEFNKDKMSYYSFIFNHFPNSKLEFNRLWGQKTLIENAAKLFNGNIVKDITGKEGKELGEIMVKLKTILTPAKVVTMDADSIRKLIESYM